MTDKDTCTKNGCDEPRAKGKPWCKAHLAEYQREYMDGRDDKAELTGYAKGVTAMRILIVEEFNRLGASSFNGFEAARWVLGAAAPKLDD